MIVIQQNLVDSSRFDRLIKNWYFDKMDIILKSKLIKTLKSWAWLVNIELFYG